MKRVKILLFILIVSSKSYSQLSNEMSAYYPNGKKITFTFSRIKDIIDSIGFQQTSSHSNKYAEVFFKKLTNQPLFILFLDKPFPLKINEAINSFNYNKYINSYDYYFDLKSMIQDQTLTKTYLLNVFNNPDTKLTNENNEEVWIYRNVNLKVVFIGEIAKNADVINYKSIIQNELAIPEFNVVGDDYSIGCNISFLNSSKKTIKYIYITLTATNAVHDRIGTKTVKGIGPIPTGESASYEFNSVIYSRVSKYLQIDNIRVQYMDGSIKVLGKNQIENIRITDWEEYGNRTIDD